MLRKPNNLYSLWPITCKITGGPFKSSSLANLMKIKIRAVSNTGK
jgi:hypothetical protein